MELPAMYRLTFRDVALAALIALPMIIPAAPSPRAQQSVPASPSATHPQIVQLAQADAPRFSAVD
jgi:hypothetical protein